MPTFYNWRVKRSGAGLRIIGDVSMSNSGGIITKGHKISNIGSIDFAGNIVQCYDRTTGKVVAVLSTRSN